MELHKKYKNLSLIEAFESEPKITRNVWVYIYFQVGLCEDSLHIGTLLTVTKIWLCTRYIALLYYEVFKKEI